MSKVNDYLTEAGTYFLATTDGDQPKIRPLGLHFEMDGKTLFGLGDFKEVYRQMKANPKVEIVALKPDRRHWLRYTGTAVLRRIRNMRTQSLRVPRICRLSTTRRPDTILLSST